MTAPETFTARCSLDLIALVPVALGFRPRDSVVLLTFGGQGASFHARVDLPTSPEERAWVVDSLTRAVRRNQVRSTAVVCFSDDRDAVERLCWKLVDRLLREGCEVVDVVRADGQEWFPVPQRGAPGTPYDLDAHAFTAERVLRGHVTLPSREALVASLASEVDPLLAARCEEVALEDLPTAAWVAGCVDAATSAEQAALPDHHAAARLVVALRDPDLRDAAWAGITRDTARAHVRLWTDLVRRSPPTWLPGPASVLAFAAWQAGDGALAWCAVDRAREVDPEHSLARLVCDLLLDAIPPDSWEPLRERSAS